MKFVICNDDIISYKPIDEKNIEITYDDERTILDLDSFDFIIYHNAQIHYTVRIYRKDREIRGIMWWDYYDGWRAIKVIRKWELSKFMEEMCRIDIIIIDQNSVYYNYDENEIKLLLCPSVYCEKYKEII